MPTKQITITQALAEIRTLKARITKRNEFVLANVAYPNNMIDPHARNGGSEKVVTEARQSISDMQERIVLLRTLISKANHDETLTIGRQTRTINSWLAWKREVAPDVRRMLANVRENIDRRRNTVANEVHKLNQQQSRLTKSDALQIDVVSAVDEMRLAQEIEEFEQVWGELDGELTMVNSRIVIEVPL